MVWRSSSLPPPSRPACDLPLCSRSHTVNSTVEEGGP
eukprot:CAMPEP_0117683522 /NCGR_PEP_ID=MMETSP0804-20121206/20456_1 /TAXON_ID=1074897 /ORGANISM="Tetraselmis astigmatica, Strain CCMP880" /LENGTH=36 /DNA_ID= /DNA_START= /DNA_END= /DNA_ORIENTATION=